MPDIDIDFANRDIILDKITHRVAKLDTGKKHNTGVYVTECPHNPVDNLSTIDYETAEDRGYFKLDFLNVSIYKDVKDETHLMSLMRKEPLWELLEHKDFVDKVFHLSGHDSLLKQLKSSRRTIGGNTSDNKARKETSASKDWKTIMNEVWPNPQTVNIILKSTRCFLCNGV